MPKTKFEIIRDEVLEEHGVRLEDLSLDDPTPEEDLFQQHLAGSILLDSRLRNMENGYASVSKKREYKKPSINLPRISASSTKDLLSYADRCQGPGEIYRWLEDAGYNTIFTDDGKKIPLPRASTESRARFFHKEVARLRHQTKSY